MSKVKQSKQYTEVKAIWDGLFDREDSTLY